MNGKYSIPVQEERKSKQKKRIKNIVEGTLPDHCVYVLECFSPDQVSEIKESQDGSQLIRVGQGLTSDQLFYVGWSNRNQIEDRLYHHKNGLSRAAKFTQQYEPMSVQEIRWYDSEGMARQQEAEVADEYRRSTDSKYVYHRHNRHEQFHWDL